jgi:hypothetical protein
MQCPDPVSTKLVPLKIWTFFNFLAGQQKNSILQEAPFWNSAFGRPDSESNRSAGGSWRFDCYRQPPPLWLKVFPATDRLPIGDRSVCESYHNCLFFASSILKIMIFLIVLRITNLSLKFPRISQFSLSFL